MPSHAKPVVRYRQDCTKPKDLTKFRAVQVLSMLLRIPKISQGDIVRKWPVTWPGHSTPKYARVALMAETWNHADHIRSCNTRRVSESHGTRTYISHVYSLHRTGKRWQKCESTTGTKLHTVSYCIKLSMRQSNF